MKIDDNDKGYQIATTIGSLLFGVWLARKVRKEFENPNPKGGCGILLATLIILAIAGLVKGILYLSDYQEHRMQILTFLLLSGFFINFCVVVFFIHKAVEAIKRRTIKKRSPSGMLTPELLKRLNRIGNVEIILYIVAFIAPIVLLLIISGAFHAPIHSPQ